MRLRVSTSDAELAREPGTGGEGREIATGREVRLGGWDSGEEEEEE